MKAKTLLEHGNPISDNATDYETAITLAGQGKFQYTMMAALGLYYVACTFETFAVSYLLPSAECDLRMTSHEKSILNSSPLVGTLIGAFLWGKLADSWGRRSVVLTALSTDAVAGLLSSLMQSFWPFVFFRFLTGLTIMAAGPVCFPYLGEFHSSKFRSRALVWMEMFAALGSILIPLVAWAIIPRPWLLGSAEIGFRYNSWRMFIAASALPSVVSATAIYFSPESPAILLAKGRHDEALEVFRRIYHRNTGRSPSSYPVKQLEMNVIHNKEAGCDKEKSDKESDIRTSKIMVIIIQIFDLFRPPLLKNTMIGLSSLFSLQLGFFGFGMWFPELFNRFEVFQSAHPNETASVCEVANMKTEKPEWLNTWENRTDTVASMDCSGDTIQPQVFINTFSIGLACIICSTLTGTFMQRIGRKRVIVITMGITACCGAGSYFVRSAGQNLALSCALQGFNGAAFSTIMSVIIELYPATLRGFATTTLMNISNVGSIVGNLLFGFLLDVNCAYPVFISAGVIGVFIINALRPVPTLRLQEA